MINVSITGANGFLGSALVKYIAHHTNFSPISIVRNTTATNRQKLISPVYIENLSDKETLSKCLSNTDVLIHTAAITQSPKKASQNTINELTDVNFFAALELAKLAACCGVKRFIFISSVKVNGETTIHTPFTEEDTPSPSDAYAISKYNTEMGLFDLSRHTKMEIVVIRPPLIYGPGVKANFHNLMILLNKGYPLPLSSIKNKRSYIYVDNLADLIIKCIDSPAAANQVFLASDGEDLSTPDLIMRLGNAIGKPTRLFPIPPKLLKSVASILNKGDIAQRLCDSLQIGVGKANTLLNWKPPVSINSGLDITAADFLKKHKG